FFFSSRRRHTRFSRDWSSDVCSSDLNGLSVDRRSGLLLQPCQIWLYLIFWIVVEQLYAVEYLLFESSCNLAKGLPPCITAARSFQVVSPNPAHKCSKPLLVF